MVLKNYNVFWKQLSIYFIMEIFSMFSLVIAYYRLLKERDKSRENDLLYLTYINILCLSF